MFNISEHILLAASWVLFCVFHSVFASEGWKTAMKKFFGQSLRFYRFYYSVFSALSLSLILFLLIIIRSPVLWEFSSLFLLLSSIIGIAGILIMLSCMKKYFSAVSGLKAFSTKKNAGSMLQTGGLHRYIRHPLYLGTLLFIWSLFCFFPYASNFLSCLLVTIYTLVGIQIEERKLVLEFGESYKEYIRRVPMLIPRLSPRRGKSEDSLPETA